MKEKKEYQKKRELDVLEMIKSWKTDQGKEKKRQ